jgi:hypothetical protein
MYIVSGWRRLSLLSAVCVYQSRIIDEIYGRL